jgi:hypothetical protein
MPGFARRLRQEIGVPVSAKHRPDKNQNDKGARTKAAGLIVCCKTDKRARYDRLVQRITGGFSGFVPHQRFRRYTRV